MVINEIYYDPPDNTQRLEFIELHNAGASPVAVGGWRLEDGVDFTFPAGATIAAGGYFVVAEDAGCFNRFLGWRRAGCLWVG